MPDHLIAANVVFGLQHADQTFDRDQLGRRWTMILKVADEANTNAVLVEFQVVGMSSLHLLTPAELKGPLPPRFQ